MPPKPSLTRLLALCLGGCLLLPAAAQARPSQPETRKQPPAFRQPLPAPQRLRAAPTRLPGLDELVVYFRQQGIRAYQAGRYREAAAHLRKALDLQPGDRLAQQWLVKIQGIAKKG